MEKLKLTDLKRMQPNTIFARGDDEKPWVAVRGDVEDWAVYEGEESDPKIQATRMYQALGYLEDHDWEHIAERGNKVQDEKKIKKLVPSTKGAMERYRH
jgi:hypothetical protein